MNRIMISKEDSPCFNLALEEELLAQADGGTLLYLWANQSCVVLGRNQNPYIECDMDYMELKGIGLVRRKSGGGAVYQDPGNLNYTFINREGEGNRKVQQEVLLGVIGALGIKAVCSGRNDILVDGKKVSGQAGYCEGGNEYLHGTLMVQVDLDCLGRCLRPCAMKLESKGIRSIRSRVANLSEYAPGITVKQVQELLAEEFIRILGPCHPIMYRDKAQGKPGQQGLYESRAWIVDNCPEYTVCQEMPWKGGILKLRLQVKDGIILNTECSCDTLSCDDISWISMELKGVRYDREEVMERIMERGKQNGCI